ncbi:MAG: hypothetical protein LBN37_02565 [Bacteroidales bacterium]|jgi:hypothetical protein|nr:hypothetical protein [Bacteroidales bacterium]
MKHVFLLILFCCALPVLANEKLPKLAGDGILDDTKAIQALLDTKASVVYLPPPKKHYVISQSLRIHSDQTLKLDAATVIRLSDNANDYMLTNDNLEGGNKNIVVSGGIWNGNNVGVHHAKGERNGASPRDFFIGSVFILMNVENLRIEHLTVKDPEKFGIHIAACCQFTVNDITFDYNAKEYNMDGVHLQGGCRFGRVTNLKGNTYDDMVALNANDGEYWEITQGAITDIQIDGIWASNCFRAVRFLSTGSPVKRISISNIFGSYFTNAIAFTHWRMALTQPPRYEDITIQNVFTAKVTDEEWLNKLNRSPDGYAIIGIEGLMEFNNLTVSNVSRTEWLPGAAPTIHIQQGTVIESLHLSHIRQTNMTNTPLTFMHNDATILHLFIDGVVISEKNTDLYVPVIGDGRTLHRHGEFTLLGNQEVTDEIERAKDEVRTKPKQGMVL